MEDQSAPIPEEITSKFGGSIIETCPQGSRARLGAPRVGEKMRTVEGSLGHSTKERERAEGQSQSTPAAAVSPNYS